MTPKEFTDKYLPYAKQDTTIPYKLTLAQAALESGWGEHSPQHNFFGIKCGKTWEGKKQLLTTTEIHDSVNVKYPEVISIQTLNNGKFKYRVKDCFRAYDSPLDSFKDHNELLLKNWKSCITTDALQTITNIQYSPKKYATDPNYVSMISKIIKMIEKYDEVV